MDLAGRLAVYVLSTRYEALDRRTVKEAKARMIDAVGCAIGAIEEAPVKIARKVVEESGGKGGSTVLGTRRKTASDLATFVNGIMVRYFDFNDTYLSKEPAHPSDNFAPCLAVAEAENSSGKELVAAVVAAYEVQCRLCDAADLRHRGWDHVNYGLVSTSLAAGKLMGLDAGRARQAVNIAVNAHIAMRQVRAGELSMWKGASFAEAARNAVFAAKLARQGMSGPSPIFEGEMGFFAQVSGPFKLEVDTFGGKGGDFKVKETYVKYWPAEYHAQTAVWAALDARTRVGEVDQVKEVLVQTHEAGFTILGKDPEKWKPGTKETADHSLPFIVGMALLHGKLDNSTYSERNLRDPKNLGFVARVKVEEDPGLTKMYPSLGMPNRVTVKLARGGSVSSEVIVPRGHPLNPMTKDDIEAKFLALTRRRLGERGARTALDMLWAVDDVEDVGDLLDVLRVRRATNA